MKKEEENIDVYLKSLGAKGLYKVPENYFENLENSILKKIEEKKNHKKAVVYQFYWVSAAAILLVSGFLFWFNISEPKQAEANLLNTDIVLEEIGSDNLSLDLLCDAGWCLELEEMGADSDSSWMSAEELLLESDLLLEEI